MQVDFQREKKVVLDAYQAIDIAAPDAVADTLALHCATDYVWRGMHPFNSLQGVEQVASEFWAPLKRSMGPLQRRPDLFLAGINKSPDITEDVPSVWVVQMGHLMGLFDHTWLTIPATRKIAFLRYVEFHRVVDGKIRETTCFIDLLSLIQQAGLNPLPPQSGAAILTPGPRTHDGLLYDQQDSDVGIQTARLIRGMVDDLVRAGVSSSGDHLAKFWHPDMCWFGPGGIGASAFFDGYHRGHTKPFEDGLEFVRHNGHPAMIGEGNFGGFFGYPSLTVKCTGNFLGMPATGVDADMRIVDMYRREGDRLAENWIFIDLLHFFAMQGLDILGRLDKYPR